ncbi:DUF4192 domain-containing protein [Arthrobacter sp. Edens01]|uniref:DUF4192 domain-containing protein n=1 Tax=Arthrobacter sp. Edens01 TaxID=1732020 RepID=UPI0006DC72BD|nr:DUF4192 domain-containing protein [Arthrobacter sp. Edens01]
MNDSQGTGPDASGPRSAAGKIPTRGPEGPPGPEPSAAGRGAPETLRVGSPQDILAFVPHCLGFGPQESLVLLGLRGSRLGATLRLDLPDASYAAEDGGSGDFGLVCAYTARISSLLAGDDETDGVLMVMYTDLPWQEGTPPPYSGVVELLTEDLAENGIRLRDGWLVGQGIWRDYFCGDSGCCPWPGNPLGDVMESRLNAELVYRGSAYASSLQDTVGGAGRFRNDDLDAAVDSVSQRMLGLWTRPGKFGPVLEAWDRRIRSMPQPNSPGSPVRGSSGTLRADRQAEDDALLLASLAVKPVRDTVLVLAALGMETALEGSGLWLGGEAGPVSGRSAQAGVLFRAVLIGNSRLSPDWDRLDRAYGAFSELALMAGGEQAAALLTLLGWIEWARGRSSRAELYLSGALGEEPGYRLAVLLRELLRRGELPKWSQSPETAWRGAPVL